MKTPTERFYVRDADLRRCREGVRPVGCDRTRGVASTIRSLAGAGWLAAVPLLALAVAPPAAALDLRVAPGESIQAAFDQIRSAGCPAGSAVTVAEGVFREMVHLRCGGVTLRGSGQAKTVISAADPLVGWEPCTAATCPGVPDPSRVHRKQVRDAWYWAPLTVGVLEILGERDARHYWLAQDVNQDRAQDPKTFRFRSKHEEGRSVADRRLPKLDYRNALLQIHATPNLIYLREVESARPGELVFAGKPLRGIEAFGVANHLAFLDASGEFVVGPAQSDGTRWVYVVPFARENLENGRVQIGVRPHVISASGIDGSGIVIEDLTVEGTLYRDAQGKQIPRGVPGRSSRGLVSFQRGRAPNRGVRIRRLSGRWSQVTGIDVPNADGLVVDSIEMYGFRGHTRCLMFAGSGNGPTDEGWRPTVDASVVDSEFRNCGAGTITPWRSVGTLIARNTIDGGHEVHGNGVAIYLYAADLLFAENRVSGFLRPVTIQAQSGQITFWRNVHHVPEGGQGCLRQWPWRTGQPGRIVALNNTCLGPGSSISLSYPPETKPPYRAHHIVANNIMPTSDPCWKGDGSWPVVWDVSGPNLLWDWRRSWIYRGIQGGRFCAGRYKDPPGQVRTNGLRKVLVDPDAPLDAIRIKTGGPAAGGGIDPTPFLPIERFSGRYDFGLRPDAAINMGAQIYH